MLMVDEDYDKLYILHLLVLYTSICLITFCDWPHFLYDISGKIPCSGVSPNHYFQVLQHA